MRFRRSPNPARPVAAALSREEALAAIPVPNDGVETIVTEEGRTRLVFPLAHRPWVKRLAALTRATLPPAGTKALELDELGAWTWRLIDGQRSVADICREFGASWRLQPRESELAVTAFLRELGKRGLLLMLVREEGKKKGRTRK
ncbi:PqqD family protein [Megalodesulfovibrio paquesii]